MTIQIHDPDKRVVESFQQGAVMTLPVSLTTDPLTVGTTFSIQLFEGAAFPGQVTAPRREIAVKDTVQVEFPGSENQTDRLKPISAAGGLRFEVMEQIQGHLETNIIARTAQLIPGHYQLLFQLATPNDPERPTIKSYEFQVTNAEGPGRGPTPVTVTNSLDVRKDRTAVDWTPDAVLSVIIKRSLHGMEFGEYTKYIDLLLCNNRRVLDDCRKQSVRDLFSGQDWSLTNRRYLPFNDTDAYRLLKAATEAFVVVKSAVCMDELCDRELLTQEIQRTAREISARGLPDDPVKVFTDQYLQKFQSTTDPVDDVVPYLALIAERLGEQRVKYSIFPAVEKLIGEPNKGEIAQCVGLLRRKLTCPILLELIWSYWHEQGTQAVTMFAIRNRFQNRRTGPAPDPLASMEIGALRPLNNLLWGYIQDEQHRLTPSRRGYEYDHHYGLKMPGSSAATMQTADSRSRFLEAWHNLLFVCTQFYREDDDTNRKADAFRVLNAIKEVHFLLSEGAHNQFGDLPTTSRIEMLMEQWMLARPEMREFLPSRESVAYPEEWMGAVDSMKTLQGWSSTSVLYFHDLGRFGEQVLLSIRYVDWSRRDDVNSASNWARIWRSEIQGYIHAYRVVTGADLAVESTQPRLEERRLDPSILLQRRILDQRRQGAVMRGGVRIPHSPTAGAWAGPGNSKRQVK